MYSSGPSSNVSAAVPGTVQVVITCASGVERVRSWKSGAGLADTSMADESRPTTAKSLDNMIGGMRERGVSLLYSTSKSAPLYTRIKEWWYDNACR